MNRFFPKMLTQSLIAVRRKHPDRVSMLDGTADPDGTRAMDALREKARTQTADELLQSLTDIERKIVSWLILDGDQQIQYAARAVATRAPAFFQTTHLWGAFASQDDQARAELRGLLSPRDLNTLQLTLLQPETFSSFFAELRRCGLSLDDAWEEAQVLPGRLRDQVIAAGVMSGSLSVWDLYDEATVRRQLQLLPQSSLPALLANFYEHQCELSIRHMLDLPPVNALMQRLVSKSAISHLDAPARVWFERLLQFAEAKKFFAHDGNRERYDYWAKYFDQVEVYVQHEEKRLFLEFANFGVIEFEEVGNAAYIYERRLFSSYLRDAQQFVANSELKDRQSALGRVIHRDGWQRATDLTLASYGVWARRTGDGTL